MLLHGLQWMSSASAAAPQCCTSVLHFLLTQRMLLSLYLQGDDAFAQSAVDVFRFSCKAVGEMHMLRVSHNNIGRSSDWHLEKVLPSYC